MKRNLEKRRKRILSNRKIIGLVIFLTIIIALLPVHIPVRAEDDAFEVVYDVFPKGGSSSAEEVLIIIRAFPSVPHEAMWVYVFWDSRCIVMRQSDVIVSDVHQNRWDITFYPPVDLCKEDTHDIWIWVEDSSNNIVKKFWSHPITDTIPQNEWWENLPQEFIDEITGPAGSKGDSGIQGIPGGNGTIGPQGLQGIQGVQGEIGPPGVPGPIGLQGKHGEDGEDGEDGKDGKNAPIITLYVVLIISVFNSLGVLLLFSRGKK